MMESPMQAWLLSNVAGWDDDVVSGARFKALTGQRADWEGRFAFWKDLIVVLARHLNLLIVDTHSVQHCWFLRGGLTPLCIRQVLLELCKSGDVQSISNLHKTESSFSWFWQQLAKKVYSDSTIMETRLPGRLVITALVHERIAAITKCISENCWMTTSVITIDNLNNICGGEEDASIITRELIKMKRGKLFVSDGNKPIKGFKISLNEDGVSDISKLDMYMLRLFWTVEKLNSQISFLETAYKRSKQSAMKAIKDDRIKAKKHVHYMHTLATSKQKCCDFHAKIQEVLLFIEQAETTKQVSEALKTGANVLKEHTLPLEDIELCLQDLDEAVLSHNEVAEALGTSMNETGDEALEGELADLELELHVSETDSASTIYDRVADVDNEKDESRPLVATADVIERAMKHLELA